MATSANVAAGARLQSAVSDLWPELSDDGRIAVARLKPSVPERDSNSHQLPDDHCRAIRLGQVVGLSWLSFPCSLPPDLLRVVHECVTRGGRVTRDWSHTGLCL